MIELKAYNNACKKIIKTSSIYFSNVLTFHTPGRVWVDNEEKIKLILVYSDYQKGFQFMGSTVPETKYAEIKEFVDTVISDFMKQKNLTVFEYGADTDALIKMLDRIFAEKEIGRSKQLIFEYKGNSGIRSIGEKCEKYKIVPIDHSFFNNKYTNMNYIIDEIMLSNGSIEYYLKDGLGYAAIDNDSIIARAMVVFQYAGMDNISVDTLEEYRNKGLSTMLALKTLEQILARKHIPLWDCDEGNIPSKKVAEKCGFVVSYQEQVCWFII